MLKHKVNLFLCNLQHQDQHENHKNKQNLSVLKTHQQQHDNTVSEPPGRSTAYGYVGGYYHQTKLHQPVAMTRQRSKSTDNFLNDDKFFNNLHKPKLRESQSTYFKPFANSDFVRKFSSLKTKSKSKFLNHSIKTRPNSKSKVARSRSTNFVLSSSEIDSEDFENRVKLEGRINNCSKQKRSSSVESNYSKSTELSDDKFHDLELETGERSFPTHSSSPEHISSSIV